MRDEIGVFQDSLRGFRDRRDADAAAGPDLGGLVVLTAVAVG
jgi:hypothetical protein